MCASQGNPLLLKHHASFVEEGTFSIIFLLPQIYPVYPLSASRIYAIVAWDFSSPPFFSPISGGSKPTDQDTHGSSIQARG